MKEAFAESAMAGMVENVKADLAADAVAEAAEATLEIADHVKNTKQHVQSVVRNVLFRLNQAATGQFIARNAIRTKDLEEIDSDSLGIHSKLEIFFILFFFFFLWFYSFWFNWLL